MKSALTLDKAGRMVLPQRVRNQFGLRAGSQLELRVGTDAISLYPITAKASMTNEGGLYVHEGLPSDSLADAVAASRDERGRAVWGALR